MGKIPKELADRHSPLNLFINYSKFIVVLCLYFSYKLQLRKKYLIKKLLELADGKAFLFCWFQFCGLLRKEGIFHMSLETTIKYGNGSACFKIHSENPGIYFARLTYFDGSKPSCPPPKITLVRGVRHWTGSFEDETLLNKLGRAIDEKFNTPLPD